MGYEEIEKRAVELGIPIYQYQRIVAQRVQKLTAELNFAYHEPDEVVRLFSELIGKPVGEGFCLFPPFYTDYGQNITIGRNVFLNTSCHFRDQGGITMGMAPSLATTWCWTLLTTTRTRSASSTPIRPLS